MEKMNLEKWDAKVAEIESAIREVKERRTESYQPRWKGGSDDWKLASLKEEATRLYSLRATRRGRQHTVVALEEEAVEALLQWGREQGFLVTVSEPALAAAQ